MEVEVEAGQDEEEGLLLVHFEELELDSYGLVQDHEEVVQGVLDNLEDVVHLELVDLEDVVHLELIDLEEVVHLELVDDLDDVVHFELVEEVLVELQGVEVDLEEVQRLEVVLRQLVDDDLDEVVQGLVEEVVQGLLVEVEQGVEQEVLVQVVTGVQVQVLQLVVTTGLPAVVILWTSHFSEVVVVAGHSLPTSQVTVGQTGPVSYGLVVVHAVVVGVAECLGWPQTGVPFDTMHVAGEGYECAGLHSPTGHFFAPGRAMPVRCQKVFAGKCHKWQHGRLTGDSNGHGGQEGRGELHLVGVEVDRLPGWWEYGCCVVLCWMDGKRREEEKKNGEKKLVLSTPRRHGGSSVAGWLRGSSVVVVQEGRSWCWLGWKLLCRG